MEIKKAIIYLIALVAMASFALASINCYEADFDYDGDVDLSDFAHFGSWYNTYNCTNSSNWCEGCDFLHDGDVDLGDFSVFSEWYNKICYSCLDSDGDDYNTTGNVTGYDNGDYYNYFDYCVSGNTIEYTCDGYHYESHWVNCALYGGYCQDGRCVHAVGASAVGQKKDKILKH